MPPRKNPKKNSPGLRLYDGPIEKGPDGKWHVAKPKPPSRRRPPKKEEAEGGPKGIHIPESKKKASGKSVPGSKPGGSYRSADLEDKRVMRRHPTQVLADRVYKAVFFGGKRLTDYPWENDFKHLVRRHLTTYTSYRKMLLRALIAREVLMRGATTRTEAAERFGDQIHTQQAQRSQVSKALDDLRDGGLVTTTRGLVYMSRDFHTDPELLASQMGAAKAKQKRFDVKRRDPKGDIDSRRRAELKRRGLLKHLRGKGVSPKLALHRARMFDLYGRDVEPDKLVWSDKELLAYLKGKELPPREGLHGWPRHKVQFEPGVEFHDDY